MSESFDVNDAVVEAAVTLRHAADDRLPMADALIAGCAVVHGLILVHRDQHFKALPASRMRQLALPLG